VWYPNAGKSTFISRISAARPKIADYPFTTLQPNLGVVVVGEAPDEFSFVVADIPGLIEGASEGAGLGTQFLRHIERTRLLVHLVDVSDASGRPDPTKDYELITKELASFGAGLDGKPTIVVASKIDAVNKEKLAKLKRYCKRKKLELYAISAVTGEGIEDLKWAMAKRVEKVREAKAPDVRVQLSDDAYSSFGDNIDSSPAAVKRVARKSRKQIPRGLNITPRSANAARRGDPGSPTRNDKT